MALIFPASPTLNQTYVSNGVTWTWQGAGWGKTSTAYIADGSITTVKIADLAVTSPKLATAVTNSIAAGGGPKISSIVVTDSSYTSLDDTAVSSTGGYIKLTGTGFAAGCTVTVGTINATTTTYVSATEVRAQLSAGSAGSYTVYLSNTDGGAIFKLNGVTFSAPPVWTTGSYTSPVTVSTQLLATGDSTLTYTLTSGSLPSGITLSSSGLLSGTTTVAAYSFTVTATDAQLQDVSQVISLTVVNVQVPVEYLVVGGGGGGGDGGAEAGGGGGAGGYLTASGYTVNTGSVITVTVGGGGAWFGGDGGNSVFSGVTSAGGGGGAVITAAWPASAFGSVGRNGGSGGGGSGPYGGSAPYYYDGPGAPGGASLGNSVDGTPTTGGNAGGKGSVQSGRPSGGGGGGAGAVGQNAIVSSSGGSGGVGLQSSISGTATYYAGGGGGMSYYLAGSGGNGGGAPGNSTGAPYGTDGTANSGGGGGGGISSLYPTNRYPTNGGSGIVIIRYADTYVAAASTTGSPTITTAGGYRVYKWTSSGSITF